MEEPTLLLAVKGIFGEIHIQHDPLGLLLQRSRPRLSNEWTEIPIPGVSVTGPDTRVCLNRSFITKALRFGLTEIEVQDALSPVVFTAPGKKMVAMPLRLEGEIPATAQASSSATEPSSQEAAQPTETAPAAPRPPLEAQPKTEQDNTMRTTNNITTLPAHERGDLKPCSGNRNGGNNGDTSTALKAVMEQVEEIKTNLREVISDLNDTLDLLKAAEKEKKATIKEVQLRALGFKLTKKLQQRGLRNHMASVATVQAFLKFNPAELLAKF